MKAIIKNNTICIDDKEIDFNSLFSKMTIEKSNSSAEDYYENICVINELYEEFVLPSFDAEFFLNDNFITEVDLLKANEKLLPIFEFVCRKCKCGIQSRRRLVWIKAKMKIETKINKIGTFLFLLYAQVRQKYEPVEVKYDSIVFVRSKSTKQKFSKIPGIDKLDETRPGYGSLYRQVSRYKRIVLLFNAMYYVRKYERDISDYLKKYNMSECILFSLHHYSKRLIHTAFYCLLQDCILNNNNWKTIYTGNNLDRFAMNEDMLSKKHKMKLICIPHGIEYGYKFPKCFVGDKFYTTSVNAAVTLNKLYGTDKFKYSSEIGNIMFKIDRELNNYEKKIVYFSEPREFEVNIEILDGLLETLKSTGVQMYIKLHPIDDRNNYERIFGLGIKEIKDLKNAVCGNICLARKSTTLIEATYNGSEAIAILINEKDRCMFESFPSLLDKKIKRFYSIKEAGKYIERLVSRE